MQKRVSLCEHGYADCEQFFKLVIRDSVAQCSSGPRSNDYSCARTRGIFHSVPQKGGCRRFSA
eukprot:341863-Pleurochrysis_carterae.AAC.1